MRRVEYSQWAYVATVMGLLFCCPKRDKKEPKRLFFGEAFRFDIWVRLKDQYKNECGQ